jgi:hypothetical protein
MTRGRILVGCAALLFGLQIQSKVPASSQADRPVPFKVGETLTYDVSWSTFMTAGSAALVVKERRAMSGGGAAYDLVADGRPIGLLDAIYHVYYKSESLLDVGTLRPVSASLFSEEAKRTTRRLTRFTGRNIIEFQPDQNAPVEKRTVPEGSLDPLSAFYVIRTQALASGRTFAMSVVDGSDIYKTQWQISGPEPIAASGSTTQAWKLTPTMLDERGQPIPNMRLTLWISNDARKVPLKLQVGLPVGNFVLTLSKSSG